MDSTCREASRLRCLRPRLTITKGPRRRRLVSVKVCGSLSKLGGTASASLSHHHPWFLLYFFLRPPSIYFLNNHVCNGLQFLNHWWHLLPYSEQAWNINPRKCQKCGNSSLFNDSSQRHSACCVVLGKTEDTVYDEGTPLKNRENTPEILNTLAKLLCIFFLFKESKHIFNVFCIINYKFILYNICTLC